MILSCPNCTTRYLLPAQVLAPDGRNVKCSSCEEVWHEMPDPDELAAEQQPEDIPDSVKPIPEGSSVPALPGDVSGEPSKALASYGAAAAVFFLVFTLLFVFHQPVARAWPASHYLFGMMGIEPSLASEGLVFDKVKAASQDHTVTIEGSIVNLTSEDRPVPMMKASLRKGEGESLDHWFIEPPQKMLASGETVAFRAAYESPAISEGDKSASEVNVRFVLKAKAEAKTDEEGGDSNPAHNQDDQAHPSGDAKDSESAPHASAQPH